MAVFLLHLFIIFGVGLPAYLSNHNPFSREHIFVGFNEFPSLMQCSGLSDKISGQKTDLFLTVSVLGQKMSVPKRHSVGKIVEMVSQGTD